MAADGHWKMVILVVSKAGRTCNMPNGNSDTRPMTVGDWMLTLLVLAIPVVNLVMYLVWAFSDTGNVNRQNFCKASIYWFLIILGIYLVFMLFALIAGVATSTLF